MTVGEKIWGYMKEESLTQLWLSKQTGISACKINLSFNGKRNLPYEEYELICGALGVPVGKFLQARLPKQSGKAG